MNTLVMVVNYYANTQLHQSKAKYVTKGTFKKTSTNYKQNKT